MRQRLLLFLLLLLPGASALQAAEPVSDAAEEDRVAAQQTDEDAEATADAEAEAEAGDTAEANSRGSGDFVPSVQISEDLSVSFPTDI